MTDRMINDNVAEEPAGREDEAADIELDTEPREVAVPTDFAEALEQDMDAKRLFDGLSYSQRRWFVFGIEEAKKPETRQRRIDKAIRRLGEGKGER
jgi:uncharacterized protein YdeI (YjbR/CyaY-like superfamily)